MTGVVETPWGDEPMENNPNLGARLFAYAHYRAGHRHTVTGAYTDSMHVVCECGKESAPDRLDFPSATP